MRTVTREFGHNNSFPHGMTATVLEIEHVVMNDDVRKRFRWRNDAHYPQLHNVAVGAPPDDDGTDELERSDATDESPYNSPFASGTTNQGYYPAFSLGGQDDTAAASPGWPNVGSAMAVLFN
ncbi:hypothetical protein H310_12511 [Aphanomyces invadans]|uniref:Uncharacterized protein n=1 Tax=Aphanomyces invadans TaxID=157072 RepID=A0A024TH38_9STRA|nr:hypothetical protein H310_12511 [Aphanomyces invadans]ETV93460.1 hypothetical protein H310_12511 [Aphanomyces invadans]|eukprot:XP_008877802.1 hypothetical protein H310_12511 [Aphanomyces invadans]